MILHTKDPTPEIAAYQKQRVIGRMAEALIALPDFPGDENAIAQALRAAGFAPPAIEAWGAEAARLARGGKE